MKTHSFKIVCEGKPLAPGVWEREGYPAIGEMVRIFDYPYIRIFKVTRWQPRADYWAHDLFEPVAIELDYVGDAATAGIAADEISLRPPEDLLRRLVTVGTVARATITDRLHLNLCHSDFQALCDLAGLPVEPSCGLFAYEGMPLSIEPRGAVWNACSSFGGFAWEMCCYWVTLPGGAPFVMNPAMLQIATALAGGQMSLEKASAWCQMAAQENVTTRRAALAYGFADMLSLIEQEIMPAYDGAQELTRIAWPSQAFQVEAFYDAARRRRGETNETANDRYGLGYSGGDAV